MPGRVAYLPFLARARVEGTRRPALVCPLGRTPSNAASNTTLRDHGWRTDSRAHRCTEASDVEWHLGGPNLSPGSVV